MRLYGLVGAALAHSFSQRFFAEKFLNERIFDARYELFPIPSISALPDLLAENPNMEGLNVTIPFKESVMTYLDEIDPVAKSIGAINVMKKLKDGRWKGYNTDYYGFLGTMLSLRDRDFWYGKTGIIFGSGGGSKSVKAAFDTLSISFVTVSRSDKLNFLTYQTVTEAQIAAADLLVNTTPVGMWPNVMNALPIPYNGISSKHIAIDIIYNPEETQFLKRAKDNGAETANGRQMLEIQARKAWEIWNA